MNSHNNSLHQKNIFLILGFARSGTSVITRSLKALGIDLGENLVKPTDSWNPTGFFEDSEVLYNVHTKLYTALGHKMRGIRVIDKKQQTSDLVKEARASAIELLSQRFKNTLYWGFKDPGTTKVLPFWQNIFDTLNIQDHYIIALRNPLSSAQSYANLTKSDLELALLLWLMHTIPAINDSFGRKRIVVSYELLMQDPRIQLQRIKNSLNIPSISDDSAMDIFANEFLDKKLHHNKYNSEDLRSHPAITVAPLCFQVYELLMRIARDEITFDSREFSSSWQEIKNELDKIYPIYCYMDTVLQRNKQLKNTLRDINKSIIWKLLYPFRYIDDKLRAQRLKARERKQLVTAYK